MKFSLQNLFEKSVTKFFSRTGSAAVLMLLASAPASVASSYLFTFTGNNGMDATGTIDIQSGVAQSGSINVTGVPIYAPPYTLITASGSLLPGSSAINGVAKNHNGDYLTYDNSVNLANNPILTSDGIVFVSNQYAPNYYNTLIGLWGNSPGSYALFVGEAELDSNGNVIPGQNGYVYTQDNGSLTLTPVPEPSQISFGVLGMIGLLIVRHCKKEQRQTAV